MLEDIAVLSGGQVISEDLGIKQENVTLDMRGRVAASGSSTVLESRLTVPVTPPPYHTPATTPASAR